MGRAGAPGAPRVGRDGAQAAQELRIAELVAAASNREVAARVFLSPKTVEYHLRQVFTTVGAGSRVELAHVPRVPAGAAADVSPRAG